ncbi:hypothetical protein QYE76_013912 [Lolium multiflorum]|uniref:Uncharacterized protein n=1 Tax=Lolium multiflorum TaxID=4521 RepID=A0AAD8U3Z3_LOLMU|nr:hypothetical protein QYE76_013912 [Lolium multiflorum]
MGSVEQGIANQAKAIADHEAQLRQLVIGLTKSAEMAARNTESCQALSVTTERLLKQQDVINNKIDAVDSHVESINKRLASLEETIHTALEHSSGPDGHREELETQGAAAKHTLENGQLGEALQEFLLHLHHHAVVLLGFRGDLPHLRCPLERGEEGLHRHRTRDRVRKCCRIAAPGTIVYTNNEI